MRRSFEQARRHPLHPCHGCGQVEACHAASGRPPLCEPLPGSEESVARAREHGRLAGRVGEWRSECWYRAGSPEAAAWVAGWGETHVVRVPPVVPAPRRARPAEPLPAAGAAAVGAGANGGGGSVGRAAESVGQMELLLEDTCCTS